VKRAASHKFSWPARQKPAPAAGPAEPGHADPVAFGITLDPFTQRRHPAHHLVARHQRQLGFAQVAVDHVQVSATDPAGVHPHENLPGPRLGPRQVHKP
jgi:hypothetical protein